MKRAYQAPRTELLNFRPQGSLLNASPGLKEELGGDDQFSNRRTDNWSRPGKSIWGESESEQ